MILQILLLAGLAQADPLRIGIVDTGFDQKLTDDVVTLCPDGHYDFSTNTATIGYKHPHGTVVASALARELVGKDYCLVIIQMSTRINPRDIDPVVIAEGVAKAVKAGAKIINVSSNGTDYSHEEEQIYRSLERSDVVIYVAAGNTNTNLNLVCNSLPPCYRLDNMVVVGALDNVGNRLKTSNYGSPVTRWYDGTIWIKGVLWQGTSIASPRAAARYARYLLDKRRQKHTGPPLND